MPRRKLIPLDEITKHHRNEIIAEEILLEWSANAQYLHSLSLRKLGHVPRDTVLYGQRHLIKSSVPKLAEWLGQHLDEFIFDTQ